MSEAPPPRRPRLLLLSSLPPPTGGIPTWTVAILESDLRKRFEIRVVDTAPSEKDAIAGRSRFRLGRASDAIRILAQLVWHLIRFRPHVVHVNTPYYWALLRDGLAVWLAGLFGARTILHFRGGDFPEFVRGAPAWLRGPIAATLRRTDRCLALTHSTEAFLVESVGAGRVRYVPNFVRLQELGVPPDRSRRRGPVEVLFVGWIVEAKGVRELLRAARDLPEARFTLIGPREPTFAECIQPQLDALDSRVRLLPERPREEVLELYREADVFVLPTWREGFPNVILEAMAAGLPVIATPVGAIPDALRDGREGLLVPPRDAPALTRALRSLIDDPALRAELGRRARERAASEFSFETAIRSLEAVYLELLA